MNQPRSIDDTGSTRQDRRAFAIAMVIMLMIVVGLSVSMALSRFNAQALSVSRQAEKYQEHHLGRGLQEAIGAWLRQQNGRDLNEALESETGHAMDIILDDGSEVAVYLQDAQGVALSNLSGRTDQQIQEGGAILRNLVVNTTETEYLELTRPFGPTAISIRSAPDRVLDAASRIVAGEFSDRFMTEIQLLKDAGTTITRTDMTRAAQAAGLSSEQRSAMLRVFATDIELWSVIIEVRAGRGINRGRMISRYGGITRIRVNTRNTGGNQTEIGAFTTWKELSVDQRTIELADLY